MYQFLLKFHWSSYSSIGSTNGLALSRWQAIIWTNDGYFTDVYPDSKVHGVNMWPTWVLSAPDGPHVGPINLAIRVYASLGLNELSLYNPNTHLFL